MYKALIQRIDQFEIDIYHLSNQRIKDQFIEILQDFSDVIDSKFGAVSEVQALKKQLLTHMMEILQSEDYIKMATGLNQEIRPMVADLME